MPVKESEVTCARAVVARRPLRLIREKRKTREANQLGPRGPERTTPSLLESIRIRDTSTPIYPTLERVVVTWSKEAR
jgi:hypothetical protein